MYAERHGGESAADIRTVMFEEKAHWRTELAARSSDYMTRAYPDPADLNAAISDPALRLQVRLIGKIGYRAEGGGAPARGNNPLTAASLLGMGTDPVSGNATGLITVTEKGGKQPEHFLEPETYRELDEHIQSHGQLASPFRTFLRAIEAAAWVGWLPEAPNEKAKRSAARMETAFPKREHIALTPGLVKRILGKNSGSETLSLKPDSALHIVICKSGVNRLGKCASADHLF